jgi:hypothetical protein
MAIRMTGQMTHREFNALAGAFLISNKSLVAQTETLLFNRSIPPQRRAYSRCWSWDCQRSDVKNEVTRSKADAGVQVLVKNGARLIDTAST